MAYRKNAITKQAYTQYILEHFHEAYWAQQMFSTFQETSQLIYNQRYSLEKDRNRYRKRQKKTEGNYIKSVTLEFSYDVR